MKSLRTIIVAGILLVMAVVTVGAESGVVMKFAVVNPSKEQSQPAVLKAYLPKEVKSGDILRKGDLQTIYDAQQGSYYVYGEFQLKPSEVLEQEVELRDVWVISGTEIESLRAEGAKYQQLFRNTEFADRIAFLCKSVNEKLDQILDTQKVAPANPEQKISIFREDIKILEAVKADLATARSLLSQARPFSAGAVWGMILVIVIFLGVLGVSFYWVWYRQVKAAPSPESTFYVPEESSGKKKKA